jgi:hypothetical protein
MSKYEQEIAMQQEREKRAANIKTIKTDLEECRNLLAAMPHHTTGDFQQIQDWRFVESRLRWLEDMLADEQKAYNATYQVNDSAVVDVIARDTIKASEN